MDFYCKRKHTEYENLFGWNTRVSILFKYIFSPSLVPMMWKPRFQSYGRKIFHSINCFKWDAWYVVYENKTKTTKRHPFCFWKIENTLFSFSVLFVWRKFNDDLVRLRFMTMWMVGFFIIMITLYARLHNKRKTQRIHWRSALWRFVRANIERASLPLHHNNENDLQICSWIWKEKTFFVLQWPAIIWNIRKWHRNIATQQKKKENRKRKRTTKQINNSSFIYDCSSHEVVLLPSNT